MPSTADTYRDAAKEHLSRAQESFSSEQYFLTHYLAGLAVECHLREFLDYMTTIKAEFHTRGDRWKNLSRTVLNLAYEVINQGEAKWDSK